MSPRARRAQVRGLDQSMAGVVMFCGQVCIMPHSACREVVLVVLAVVVVVVVVVWWYWADCEQMACGRLRMQSRRRLLGYFRTSPRGAPVSALAGERLAAAHVTHTTRTGTAATLTLHTPNDIRCGTREAFCSWLSRSSLCLCGTRARAVMRCLRGRRLARSLSPPPPPTHPQVRPVPRCGRWRAVDRERRGGLRGRGVGVQRWVGRGAGVRAAGALSRWWWRGAGTVRSASRVT